MVNSCLAGRSGLDSHYLFTFISIVLVPMGRWIFCGIIGLSGERMGRLAFFVLLWHFLVVLRQLPYQYV